MWAQRRLPVDGRDVPARRSARGSSRRARSSPARACSTSPPAPATPPSRPPQRGAQRHRQRPHARAARRPAGRRRPRLDLEWVDGRRRGTCRSTTSPSTSSCPSIGVMFAPHHQDAADELVRVCRPGGTIGLLSWTPEGMLGALFRTMAPFAPPPPAGRPPPPLWGSEGHLRELFGDRVEWHTLERDVLEITAFERAARLRRVLQGPLRPDDRRPRQRRARTAARTSSTPRSTPSATSGTSARPTRRRSTMEYLLAIGTRI